MTIEMFLGCNEEVQKFITPEIGCERLFMSYLIIVFNNNVFGFFSKTWTYRAYKIFCLMFSN